MIACSVLIWSTHMRARVCVCVCWYVCVCVRVCVRACVCVHDNSKSNRSSNMKLEYIVVYEKISDKFDIAIGQHLQTCHT